MKAETLSPSKKSEKKSEKRKKTQLCYAQNATAWDAIEDWRSRCLEKTQSYSMSQRIQTTHSLGPGEFFYRCGGSHQTKAVDMYAKHFTELEKCWGTELGPWRVQLGTQWVRKDRSLAPRSLGNWSGFRWKVCLGDSDGLAVGNWLVPVQLGQSTGRNKS